MPECFVGYRVGPYIPEPSPTPTPKTWADRTWPLHIALSSLLPTDCRLCPAGGDYTTCAASLDKDIHLPLSGVSRECPLIEFFPSMAHCRGPFRLDDRCLWCKYSFRYHGGMFFAPFTIVKCRHKECKIALDEQSIDPKEFAPDWCPERNRKLAFAAIGAAFAPRR